MVTMKTTFDLPEQLVHELKNLARARGTTARSIVQQALMRELSEQKSAEVFVSADKSVSGWGSMGAEHHGVSLHELVLRSHERPN